MKPNGRVKNIKGNNSKVDYHIHEKNRKIGNWWEDYDNIVCRTTLKNMIKKDIEKEIIDNDFFDEMEYYNDIMQ